MTSRYPELDRLVDKCPSFKAALDDYTAVLHEYEAAKTDSERRRLQAKAATIWERATEAAQAFWAAEKKRKDAA